MAKVGHLLTSSFLSGQEVPTPIVLTVKSAEIKMLGDDGDQDEKVVLEFHELSKPATCNKTRLAFMIENFGDDTAGYVGQKIMVYGQKLASGKFAGQWTIIFARPPATPIQTQPAQEEAFTV